MHKFLGYYFLNGISFYTNACKLHKHTLSLIAGYLKVENNQMEVI